MKVFKKAIAMTFALILAFSLAACSFQSVDGLNSSVEEEIVTPDSVVIVPEGEAPQNPSAEKEVKYLRNKVEKAGRVTLDKNSDCPADFVLNVEGSEPIRILQITDTQMIDHTQVRLGNGAVTNAYADRDRCIYDIVRYTVEQTNPDLILLTGDYVYGDYDDNGSLFREQTDFFDSLGIYWAVIFGNHDNDSDSEYARWLEDGWNDWYGRKQCQYLEAATHCLFRTRAEVTGYSNFSIAIKQNGEFVRTVFMLDTHGSHSTAQEINATQLKWYKSVTASINEYAGKALPQFIGIHVPLYAFSLAAQMYGYKPGTTTNLTIPENENGDFGIMREGISGWDKDMKVFNTFKANGVDAILAGHLHKNNTSILYEGVRLVFGTKSSRYDKTSEDMLGGTIFTVTSDNFTVAPVYYTGA